LCVLARVIRRAFLHVGNLCVSARVIRRAFSPPGHCRGSSRVIRRAEGPRHPGETHEMTGYISKDIRFLSDIRRSYHHTRIGLAMNIELYVPTTTPKHRAKAKSWITGPPKM